VRHLREYFPGAHLIFATTTPMNPAGIEMRNPRTTEDIRRYNEAAKSVMAELSVEVNDLFAAAEGWSEDSFIDYCHLKPEAYRALAEIVVRRIAKHL